MTLLVLIFGEITPKSLAAQNAERISLIVVNFVDFSVKLFNPLIFILTFITSGLVRLLGGKANTEIPLITEAEFKTLVEVGHEEGVFEREEKNMINNVFDFSNTDAEDIMVNRTDIAACKIDASYDDIYEIFKEEGFSRIPIYDDSIDNIVGILNFRDFILNIADKNNFDIHTLLRDPYFTYESKPTAELFAVMRDKRHSMAIVLDEYGGTSGLVTLEDIVEEIVGEIDESNETVDEMSNRFVIEEIDKNRIVKLRMFTSVIRENETDETESNAV